ncbi:MAG: hypothetical protein ABEJ42_01095 [Halobacteriaceae archaeon]
MPLRVTFSVDATAATVDGVDRVRVDGCHLECLVSAGDDADVVSRVPLDALVSVEETGSGHDGGENGGQGDEEGRGQGGGEGGGHGDGENEGVEALTVTPDPRTPGATATHTVVLQVADDVDDFQYLRVDYAVDEAHTVVNEVDEGDVRRFGVDVDDDGEIEHSLATGDWSVSHGGSGYTLRLRNQEWDGPLSPGDDVIVEFEGAENPEAAGTYEVEVVLNGHQSTTGWFTVGGGEGHDPDAA